MTRIAIDPARPIGRLDRKVFGGFVEHLGRCIYGGLYDEGSPLSDDRGFRKDVLGLLREQTRRTGWSRYGCHPGRSPSSRRR